MKEFLSRNGYAYIERNVEEDDEAYHEVMERGWKAVPVTAVGDRAVRGFQPDALLELLRGVDDAEGGQRA